MIQGDDPEAYATKLIELINLQCQGKMYVVCISYNFI